MNIIEDLNKIIGENPDSPFKSIANIKDLIICICRDSSCYIKVFETLNKEGLLSDCAQGGDKRCVINISKARIEASEDNVKVITDLAKSRIPSPSMSPESGKKSGGCIIA